MKTDSVRQGFTLIELLIVILIIGILAAILIVAIIGRIGPAKIKTTYQRITMIEEGLERFIIKFPQRNIDFVAAGTSGTGLPRKKEFAGLSIRGKDVFGDMSGGEFLRLILFPTDYEIENYLADYGITEAVMTNDEVKEMLNKEDTFDYDGKLVDAETAFVDTWNMPFLYLFPGSNHSDKGYDNRKHQNIKEEYGKNHMAGKPVPEIWSCGPNGDSDEDDWVTEANDPFGESTENDDICNWFEARQ